MDAELSLTAASRRLCRLSLLIVVVAASGASCPRMVEQYRLPVSRALPGDASFEQVAMMVNENSSRIQSLSASSAKLSSSEFPTLRANLAVERPQRLRLVAEATALTGAEFDFGSNDELFWFWVKRGQPPALYYCRHEQFDSSASRGVLPVEPDWLIEALGMVTLDPAEENQGPFPTGRGRLEIRTLVRRPQGTLTKVRVIDAAHGWIVAQHVYDSTGQRLASALASGHRRDPQSQAVVPRHVEIQWPLNNFNLKIDLGDVVVNPPATADTDSLWAKPDYSAGWPDVDLAHVHLGVGPDGKTLITPASSTPGYQGAPPRRTNEARLAPPAEADANQSSAVSGEYSPLGDPQGGVSARQAGFRPQPAGSPPVGDRQQLPPRREILDYAAEPVHWR